MLRQLLLQDDVEIHYSGFKTPHIHNLSDLVQENLGAQVCTVLSMSCYSLLIAIYIGENIIYITYY